MHFYHINDCRTPAAILDKLVQMSYKFWGSDEVVAGFLRKVEEVLDLQSTMCSGGSKKEPIDVNTILATK